MSHWQLRLIASAFTIATVLHPAGSSTGATPVTTAVGATLRSR